MRGLGYGFPGGTLGANKKNLAVIACDSAQKIERVIQHWQGFFQVDDMNLATMAEYIRGHLGVPVTCLVTKVNASLKHLAHSDICHDKNSNYRVKLPLYPNR
jgi:hypothetical protein